MLQILISMGIQVHFLPMEHHAFAYSQRAAFLGVNVFQRDDSDDSIFGSGPVCKYHAVIISRRDVFKSYLDKLESSGCLSKIIFDTGKTFYFSSIFKAG